MKNLTIGVGWDTRLDVDASIIMFNNNGDVKDKVYYGQTTSLDGAIVHSKDNQSGEGHGDDEVIKIDLE